MPRTKNQGTVEIEGRHFSWEIEGAFVVVRDSMGRKKEARLAGSGGSDEAVKFLAHSLALELV